MTHAHSETEPISDRLRIGARVVSKRVFCRYTIGVWLACSALAAFSGPFGTYQSATFLESLGVWSVLLGCGTLTAIVMFELCRVVAPRQSRVQLNVIFFIIGGIAIAGVIDGLLTHWIESSPPDRPGLVMLWLYVIAVMLVVIFVRRTLPEFQEEENPYYPVKVSEHDPAKAPEQGLASLPAHSRLAQRLDLAQDVRIIHISANGHFIEVQTCKDSHRIRMRFSDAVAELDETVGLTVHRSHWVHLDAVKGWVRQTPKPYIVLENETRIPISKTYFARVEEAGLVDLSEQLEVSAG